MCEGVCVSCACVSVCCVRLWWPDSHTGKYFLIKKIFVPRIKYGGSKIIVVTLFFKKLNLTIGDFFGEPILSGKKIL